MKPISKAVDEVIHSDLRILDAMRMGIVNNRRLAQRIQPEVSKAAGQKAGISTIAVTLQRIGLRVKADTEARYSSILGRSRLQLMDDITILYMRGKPQIMTQPARQPAFYVKVQGIDTSTVFVDDASIELLDYKKGELLKTISDLSAIIITSPAEIVQTPGVIAQLMMALGGASINVVEVSSSYESTFLIVSKKDSLGAIEIVRSLIRRSRI
ncbi:MAG: hypothetical protein V1875_05150 [Candidatus Altiarchaeota archaeon]